MITFDNETFIQKEFGQLIRQMRKELDITQDKLSELVGITDVYLRDLENGKYAATWVTWLRICCVLNIDTDNFSGVYIAPEPDKLKVLLSV